MALITLPAKFGFTRVNRFGLLRGGNILRSRFTGQAQRVIYPYAVWALEAKLVEYDGAEAAEIRSFLVKLEGYVNTFKLPVPGYTQPASGEFTADVVTGAAAVVRATQINLATVSGQSLIVGDYFTVQDELKMITVTRSTPGLFTFQPPLRKAVPTNTLVTLINPYCLMHATEDDVAEWGLAAPVRHSVDFKAIEAVDV